MILKSKHTSVVGEGKGGEVTFDGRKGKEGSPIDPKNSKSPSQQRYHGPDLRGAAYGACDGFFEVMCTCGVGRRYLGNPCVFGRNFWEHDARRGLGYYCCTGEKNGQSYSKITGVERVRG